MIGTVGSKDKAEIAKKNGCHHTILYRDEDFVARVKEITGGELCDVVYDGIGKTTFPASLDCLRPLGYFVSFGSASGQIEAFNINILQTKGSLFATRPTLNHYVAKREDLIATAKDLFKVGAGAVKIPINQKYALKDAAKAHGELEGRETTGSTILIPCSVRQYRRRRLQDVDGPPDHPFPRYCDPADPAGELRVVFTGWTTTERARSRRADR